MSGFASAFGPVLLSVAGVVSMVLIVLRGTGRSRVLAVVGVIVFVLPRLIAPLILTYLGRQVESSLAASSGGHPDMAAFHQAQARISDLITIETFALAVTTLIGVVLIGLAVAARVPARPTAASRV